MTTDKPAHTITRHEHDAALSAGHAAAFRIVSSAGTRAPTAADKAEALVFLSTIGRLMAADPPVMTRLAQLRHTVLVEDAARSTSPVASGRVPVLPDPPPAAA